MADGGWIVLGSVLGALIGAISSIVTTWLNARFNKKPESPYDLAAKVILEEMLQGQKHWRTIKALSNVIGASPEKTRELLLEIGARGSEVNPELWGLISRNPLPKHNGAVQILDPTLDY